MGSLRTLKGISEKHENISQQAPPSLSQGQPLTFKEAERLVGNVVDGRKKLIRRRLRTGILVAYFILSAIFIVSLMVYASVTGSRMNMIESLLLLVSLLSVLCAGPIFNYEFDCLEKIKREIRLNVDILEQNGINLGF